MFFGELDFGFFDNHHLKGDRFELNFLCLFPFVTEYSPKTEIALSYLSVFTKFRQVIKAILTNSPTKAVGHYSDELAIKTYI